jgi:pSer/pThr/pTyr-binding forkhead associated (FHA) protein
MAPPPRRRRTLAPETVKLNVEDVRESIARAQRKQAALVVLQGSESEIGTHVMLDKAVTIGRDPKTELPLQDEGISRRHCKVFYEKEKNVFIIEDLNSTNGTLLNGKRVSGQKRLEAGDRIYLGACVV